MYKHFVDVFPFVNIKKTVNAFYFARFFNFLNTFV